MYDFSSYSSSERQQLLVSLAHGIQAYRESGDDTAASRLEGCGYRPGYLQLLLEGERVAHHRSQPVLVKTACRQAGCLFCGGPQRWHQQHHLQDCIENGSEVQIALLTLPPIVEAPAALDQRVHFVAGEIRKLVASQRWQRLVGPRGGWAISIEVKVSRPEHGQVPWCNVHAHCTFTRGGRAFLLSDLNSETLLTAHGAASKVTDPTAWSKYVCKGHAGSSSSTPALLWANLDHWRAAVRLAHGSNPPLRGKDDVIHHLGTPMISFGGCWRRMRNPSVSEGGRRRSKFPTPDIGKALRFHSTRVRRPASVFDDQGQPLHDALPLYMDKRLQLLADGGNSNENKQKQSNEDNED